MRELRDRPVLGLPRLTRWLAGRSHGERAAPASSASGAMPIASGSPKNEEFIVDELLKNLLMSFFTKLVS